MNTKMNIKGLNKIRKRKKVSNKSKEERKKEYQIKLNKIKKEWPWWLPK